MVEVDRVGLKNVVAVCCIWVDVLVNFAGVERYVVEVADSEVYGVCGRWLEVAAPAHKVLNESHLCVEAKWKPRHLLLPRGVLSPRLPRELGASVWMRSSLLDIVSGFV